MIFTVFCRIHDKSIDFIKKGRKTTKRQELVDKLLQSEGHVSSEFHYWADILRAKSNLDGVRSGGVPYVDWVKKSIRNNMPYDEFARQLLTASGSTHSNPPTNFSPWFANSLVWRLLTLACMTVPHLWQRQR